MEDTKRGRGKRKNGRLFLVTGAVVLMMLGASGCSAKQTVAPAETSVVETTVDPEEKFKIDKPIDLEEPTKEVVGTIEGGGEIGVKPNGETVYDMGKYGDLGKEVFDNLAKAWVNRNIPDEASLNDVMDATYGNFNGKEALKQEILAMERNPEETKPAETQPQATQPAKTNPGNSNNPGNGNSHSGSNKGNSNNAQTPASTKANTPQAPTQAQTPPPASTVTPEQRAEYERRAREAKENPPEVKEINPILGPVDELEDAAGQWDWQ